MASPANHATLIAALEAHTGNTTRGFTFLTRDGEEQFFSFDRLRTEARRRAAHLRAAGLKQGDRLAMVMPDGEDFIPTFIGAVWAGIIPVPLYPPLALGKLDAYMRRAGRRSSTRPSRPTWPPTPSSQTVLWSGAAGCPRSRACSPPRSCAGPARRRASQEPAHVTADDLCFLQFTSGSTSDPEGRDGDPRQPARQRLGHHARRAAVDRATDMRRVAGCRSTTTWG